MLNPKPSQLILFAAWCAVALVLILVVAIQSLSIQRIDILTGWGLLLLMLVQVLYHLRKKHFHQFGTSARWYQFHVSGGIVTILVFVIHLEVHLPTGELETLLTLLFLGVAGSGILGFFLSKLLAYRLSDSEEEIRLDEIPARRRALHDQMESLTCQVLSESNAKPISAGIIQTLKSLREGKENFWPYLLGLKHPTQVFATDCGVLEQNVDPKESELIEEIKLLIRIKENLTYHQALQTGLKAWLFLHVPLTYGLLIISLTHGVFATLYTMSLP